MNCFLVGISVGMLLLSAQAGAAQGMEQNSHLQRARDLIAAGNSRAAIAEYQAAIASDPSNVEAQGNLGVLEFFANDCDAALPHLKAARLLAPSEARMQALLGICQRRQGRLEDALNNLAAALPLVDNPRIHKLVLTNLAEIEYAQGDLPRAAASASELIKAGSEDADSLYLAYRIYADLALAAKNDLARIAPDSARMHLLVAEQFINAGDATSAIQQYQKALVQDPSLLGVHYELGEAILQESTIGGALDRAASEFQLALKENPKNAGAEAKLGIIDGIRGRADLAESHYTQALTWKPDEFNALVGMGDILRRRGENQKAADYLSRATTLSPLDDSLHYRLAQVYRDLGRKADEANELKLFAETRALKKKQQ